MKVMKYLLIMVLSFFLFFLFGEPFDVTWEEIGEGDGNFFGEAGAEADKLFTAVDDNYLYFQAKNESAGEWLTWAFIIDTRDGGGTGCPQGYQVGFGHENPPDFAMIGDFDGNWGELRVWDPENSEWAGGGTNLPDNYYVSSDQTVVEVRFPRGEINRPNAVHIQYYITGDNSSQHASFDSIPADEVAGSWDDYTELSNYISVYMPFGDPFDVVWNEKESGDGNSFIGDAIADRLYTSVDDDYLYFRATHLNIADWKTPGMVWAFLLNTAAGGGSSCPWGREIYFDHPENPNHLMIGHFGSDIGQFISWDGTQWTGYEVQRDGDYYMAEDRSEVQVRFDKTEIGEPATIDVQYYISGNNDDHGCFDSIPSDELAEGWNPPASTSNLSNYVQNVSRIKDWILH